MNSSEVRLNMRRSLGDWFRIDSWSIGLPDEIVDFDTPPSVAREKPISEVLSIERPLHGIRNAAYVIRQKLSYQVLYRLPSTLTYEEILLQYRSSFEDQTTAFCAWVKHNPELLKLNTAEPSAKVSCPELRSGDWLLSNTIDFVVTYESDYINQVKSRFGGVLK
jgi:hypothetical protein